MHFLYTKLRKWKVTLFKEMKIFLRKLLGTNITQKGLLGMKKVNDSLRTAKVASKVQRVAKNVRLFQIRISRLNTIIKPKIGKNISFYCFSIDVEQCRETKRVHYNFVTTLF